MIKIFFHVSSKDFQVGEQILPGKRGRICLATSLDQAYYWGWVLYERGKREATLEDCIIYHVDVLEDTVEDCLGHYAFEHPGVIRRVEEVVPHESLDGEVVTRSPVIVRERVKVDLVFWRSWGEDHERRVLKKLQKTPSWC